MDQTVLQPVVSVIIPVSNGVNYLAQAVESVLAQDYPAIELILVDDGSTDATWELIQSYGPRVRALRKPNGGVASALNAGIAQTRGELVAWLSHDDLFLPGKITRQVRFLQAHPEFGGVYTDFEIIDAAGEPLAAYRAPWVPARELARAFLTDMHINGSTVMMRRDCFERAGGFNEELPHTQDLEFWLRFSEQCEFGHLPEILVKFRSHPGQGSQKYEQQIAEEQTVFRGLFERYGAARFFAELEAEPDPLRRQRLGLVKFADTLREQRGWRRFALDLYRQAGLASGPKIWLTRAAIWAWGDEQEALALGKRARVLLGQGQAAESRRCSAGLWRRRPLRLDMAGLWLASWLPPAWKQTLRKLKHHLKP